jgi:hypothetical protein
MIIYNKEKTRASVINDVAYMFASQDIYGHELWINNQIFERYNSKMELRQVVEQVINAMLNKQESFELN